MSQPAGGKYQLNELAFANHVETKAQMTDAESIVIGVDFAVLIYRFPYQAMNAYNKLVTANVFYDYIIENDKTNVLIYNQHHVKEK